MAKQKMVLAGWRGSTNVARVLLVLHLLGFEEGKDFICQGMLPPTKKGPNSPAQMDGDEWRGFQPFGQMPYFVDEDGFVVYESRAICKYLAAKHSSPLLPPLSSPQQYAKFEQACAIETFHFDAYAFPIIYEKIVKSWSKLPADEVRIKALTKSLAKSLVVYDGILGRQRWLSGGEMSLADVFHLPFGVIVNRMGFAPGLTDGSLPNVKRWWGDLVELEAWKKTNARPKKAAL